MLENAEFLTVIDALGLSPKGSKLILEARIKAPVRDVVSRGGNVITLLASRKMQREISTESRSLEFFAALGYEHDAKVLEFYPQPCELRLELMDDVNGEIHSVRHIPDFLVLRRDGVSLIEWKSEAHLQRLAEKYPWRFQRDAEGRWYAPLIEQQLADWGIAYRIQTNADIIVRRKENLLALEDYFHPGAEPCPTEVLQRVREALQEDQALYLADLYGKPFDCTPDQILKGIADGELVADLDREQVTAPRRCRVYRDAAVRELLAGYVPDSEKSVPAPYDIPMVPGMVFVYEGQRFVVALVGEKSLVLTDAAGKQTTLGFDWFVANRKDILITEGPSLAGQFTQELSQYTEGELLAALKRQELLLQPDGASERNKRRWRQNVQAAQLNGTHEALALVPRTRFRGNREARLSQDQEDNLQQVISNEWLNNRAPNYKSCYRHLENACDSAGVVTPSYPTLISRIKSLDHTKSTRIRYGKRRAYQEGDFVNILSYDTPVHGSRPFQYCHIDHTQLDIELINSRTGKNMGRPWFSMAVDSYTRRILGIYLSYDPPSYQSTMMVLRDIVRRHGRLPQFIVVDNGTDFKSINFKMFLKSIGIHLRFRPAGRPRHGAVMERLFGRGHSEYVHNLSGNTKATKQVRTTTGKYLPARMAEWTLEAMYFGLEYWAFTYYDQDLHPALGLSPREAQDKGIAETGSRAHRHLICNTDFLIATCPTVDREGVRKVDRQRGVKFDDHFFSAPELRDLKVAGSKVPVRYDPWDHSTVYAYVNHRWVRCINTTLASMGPMTVAERSAMFEEYRHQYGAKPDSAVSAQRLREFLQTFTPEGAMALHRARQAENTALYGGLGHAAVMPPTNTLAPAQAPAIKSRQGAQIPSNTSTSSKMDDELPEFDTFSI